MSKQSTFDRVKETLLAYLFVGDEEVTLRADIMGDLYADSRDWFLLLMAWEEEFGFEITDEEAETLVTVGDVVSLIEHKLAEAA